MSNIQLCWVKSNNLWEKAKIIGKNEEKLIIETENNEVIEKNIYDNDFLFRNNDQEDMCNNLIDLIHLNEPSILNNVSLRYSQNNIYTFITLTLLDTHF